MLNEIINNARNPRLSQFSSFFFFNSVRSPFETRDLAEEDL